MHESPYHHQRKPCRWDEPKCLRKRIYKEVGLFFKTQIRVFYLQKLAVVLEQPLKSCLTSPASEFVKLSEPGGMERAQRNASYSSEIGDSLINRPVPMKKLPMH